ncbi:hypothetical protein GGI05_000329 [Coemansia sp. RSA 2603]|nr:hypothetical protein GGI05_000329 [Coemansia sp. RSA 2603]
MSSNNTTSTSVKMQAKGNRAVYQALQADCSAPGNDFIEVDRSIRVKYPKLFHALVVQLKDPELADKAFRKGSINLAIECASEDESDEDSDMNVSNNEDNAIFYDSLDMEVDEADVSVAINEDAYDIGAGAMATRDDETHGHATDNDDGDGDDEGDDEDDNDGDGDHDGDHDDDNSASDESTDNDATSANVASFTAPDRSMADNDVASENAVGSDAPNPTAAGDIVTHGDAADDNVSSGVNVADVNAAGNGMSSDDITSDDESDGSTPRTDVAADDDAAGTNVAGDENSDTGMTDEPAASRRAVLQRSTRLRPPYSARTVSRRSSRSPIRGTLVSTTSNVRPVRVESNDSNDPNKKQIRQRPVGNFAITEQKINWMKSSQKTKRQVAGICNLFAKFASEYSNQPPALNSTTGENSRRTELDELIQSSEQPQQQYPAIRDANGHTIVSLKGLVDRNNGRLKENAFMTNFLYLVVCGMYYAGAKALLRNIDPDMDILPLQLDITEDANVSGNTTSPFNVALTATNYQTISQPNHKKILKWMYDRMRSSLPTENTANEEACEKEFNELVRSINSRGRQYVQLCMIAGFDSLDFLLVGLPPSNFDLTTESLIAFMDVLIDMGEKFNSWVKSGTDDNFDVRDMARYADYVDRSSDYTCLLDEYSDVAAFIEAFCAYF